MRLRPSERVSDEAPGSNIGLRAVQFNLWAFVMITRQQADQVVAVWLDEHEIATIDFESPLPRHDERHIQKLVVVRVDEYEFGWVYFYDGSLHVQTGNLSDAVVGNAPLIVDKADGKLYITGTARPVEHYLEEFRQGKRQTP
jgi:hypothetical protein